MVNLAENNAANTILNFERLDADVDDGNINITCSLNITRGIYTDERGIENKKNPKELVDIISGFCDRLLFRPSTRVKKYDKFSQNYGLYIAYSYFSSPTYTKNKKVCTIDRIGCMHIFPRHDTQVVGFEPTDKLLRQISRLHMSFQEIYFVYKGLATRITTMDGGIYDVIMKATMKS